jgi:hypothetical protein
MPVRRYLGRMIKQRGIGGGVLRPVAVNGFDVAGVSDNRRVLF